MLLKFLNKNVIQSQYTVENMKQKCLMVQTLYENSNLKFKKGMRKREKEIDLATESCFPLPPLFLNTAKRKGWKTILHDCTLVHTVSQQRKDAICGAKFSETVTSEVRGERQGPLLEGFQLQFLLLRVFLTSGIARGRKSSFFN